MMLRVAQLYYGENLTQDEVARRLLLTRWKIGRLLQEARDTGLVRIEIIHPRARQHDREAQLVDRFGLRAAVVVPSQDSDTDMRGEVARAAADFLCDLRPAPGVLGVSWGRTLEAVAAAIAQGWTRGVHVVQLNGGLSRSLARTSAAEVALRIAQTGSGAATLLPAPAIVERAGTAQALAHEPAVQRTLSLARRADAILYSLGAVSEESVLVESGYLSARDVRALQAAGACGDLLGHFIGPNGQPVDPDLESRTVGLSLRDVQASKCAVVVASGSAKHEAVRAVVSNNLCSVVVTDAATATFMLEAA